jgi:hypothetical protein
MNKHLHLHWAYRKANALKMREGLSMGCTICSQVVPSDQLANAVEETTCDSCLQLHRNPPKVILEPVPEKRVRHHRKEVV